MKVSNVRVILIFLIFTYFSVSFGQVNFKPGTYKSQKDPMLQELDYSGSTLVLINKKAFTLEFHDMATTSSVNGTWYVKRDTLYLVIKKIVKPGMLNKNSPKVIHMYKRGEFICPAKLTFIKCMTREKKG